MKISKNGSLNLYVLIDGSVYEVRNHVGAFDKLLLCADKKREIIFDPEGRKRSDIVRQYLYNRVPKDDQPTPKHNIDTVKFINDYMALMGFCFEWIGKQPNDTFKIKNDLFKVRDASTMSLSINKKSFIIQDVLIKYFECIRETIYVETGGAVSAPNK